MNLTLIAEEKTSKFVTFAFLIGDVLKYRQIFYCSYSSCWCVEKYSPGKVSVAELGERSFLTEVSL